MAVERFEGGRAAAYEPGVYLENPIGMSNDRENRTGYQKTEGWPTSRGRLSRHTMFCPSRGVCELRGRSERRQPQRLYVALKLQFVNCLSFQVGTYTAPLMKTRVTPSFSFRDSCKRQTIGRGSAKMKRSEMKFMEP